MAGYHSFSPPNPTARSTIICLGSDSPWLVNHYFECLETHAMKQPLIQNYHKPLRIFGIMTMIVFFSITAAKAEVWSISLQNDVVSGTDKHYTNGISYDWMSDLYNHNEMTASNRSYVDFVYWVFRSIPYISIGSEQVSAGFQIAQDIYTPADTMEEELIEDDIPYAGHLYSKYSLFKWQEDAAEENYFRLGIVGPASGGEWVQKSFHRLIGNEEPQGWHHQLDNQVTLGVGYSRSMLFWKTTYTNGLSSDWAPSYGFEIGNFSTAAFAGFLFRFGRNYPQKPVPTSVAENVSLNNKLAYHSEDRDYGWLISAGFFANVVGYTLIVDSSKDHDVERKNVFGAVVVGITFYLNHMEMTFSFQEINMNINNSVVSNGLGALSFSLNS